jgi:hypothetical protein
MATTPVDWDGTSLDFEVTDGVYLAVSITAEPLRGHEPLFVFTCRGATQAQCTRAEDLARFLDIDCIREYDVLTGTHPGQDVM